MNEKENIEKEGDLFFSMEYDNVICEIHLDTTDSDTFYPYGIIKVIGKDLQEINFKVEVEVVVVNIVKFFGNKNTLSLNDISYFIERNDKDKLEMNFFGIFGDIKIDESSNLVYNANL